MLAHLGGHNRIAGDTLVLGSTFAHALRAGGLRRISPSCRSCCASQVLRVAPQFDHDAHRARLNLAGCLNLNLCPCIPMGRAIVRAKKPLLNLRRNLI
jgi:hypothetical protein